MYKTLYTREYQQMLALLRAKRTDAQVSVDAGGREQVRDRGA